MSRIDAADLAQRLGQQAEAVCRTYLSNGRRQGNYWQVGDVRNTAGRSMFVRLTGPASGKGAAGKWQDPSEGSHGDLLDVIRESLGLSDFADVLEEARRQFEVNLFGIARLTQLVLPSMRDRGSGTIINISSMGGRVYTPLGGWYHASKHALEGWSDCLRLELAPFGIRVVILEPGAIGTEFGELAVVPLLERSGKGPYAETAQKMAAATRRTFSSGKASPPSLIADLIVKVIRSRRPRTRYVSGYLARPVMLARRLLGDRFFDLMIRRFL